MPTSKRFPTTPEIKGIINAVRMAGVRIRRVDVGPSRITITAADDDKVEETETAFDRWKSTFDPHP